MAYWIDGLGARGVEYLVLVDDAQRGGVAAELRMIAERPERFTLLFQKGEVTLYGFNQKR